MKIHATHLLLLGLFFWDAHAAETPHNLARSKKAPPKKCAYDGVMKDNQRFGVNLALCDKGNEGFKFGINKKGVLGLWDGDGKLVENYKKGVKSFDLYWDDDIYELQAWSDEGDIIWSVECQVKDGEYVRYPWKYLKLRMNSDSSKLITFRGYDTGLDTTYTFMKLDEKGRIKLDEERCALKKNGWQ